MLEEGALVVVGGATGYCGGHVARALHEAGFRVRALARDGSKLKALGECCDEVFEARATEAETLRGLCDGASALFSSIGVRSFGRKPTIWDVDRDANLNLLREAERAGVDRVVFVSVLRGDELRRELAVAEAREQVADAIEASDVVGTILRPTGFFNDMEEFLRMAHKGRCWLIGDGEKRINPIHGADIGAAAVEALKSADAPRSVDLGGPDTFSFREIGELAFRVLGTPPRLGRVPTWVLRSAASVTRPFNINAATFIKMFACAGSSDAVAPEGGTHHLEHHFRTVAQTLTA